MISRWTKAAFTTSIGVIAACHGAALSPSNVPAPSSIPSPAEGELKGKLEGEIKARRDTLERLPVRAGITLTDEDRTRIQTCTDTAILDRWLDKVIGAKTVIDVLT